MRLGFFLSFVLLVKAASAAPTDDGGWTPFQLADGVVEFSGHVWRRELNVTLGSASPSSSVRESFLRDVLAGQSGRSADIVAFSEDAPPLPEVPLLIASRRVGLPEVYRVMQDTGADLHAGRAFFSGAIVQLDYPNRRLRLLDQDALNLKNLANVPARRVNQRIGTHIQLSADGESFWATMATEYSGALMMPRGMASQLGWLEGAGQAQGAVEDHRGREAVFDVITVPAVQLGPFRISDVDVVLMEDGDSPLAGDYDQQTAIVGNGLLRHFQISVDLDRAFVHAQPL